MEQTQGAVLVSGFSTSVPASPARVRAGAQCPAPLAGDTPGPSGAAGRPRARTASGFGVLVQPTALWLPRLGLALALASSSSSARAAPELGCAGVQGTPRGLGGGGTQVALKEVSAVGVCGWAGVSRRSQGWAGGGCCEALGLCRGKGPGSLSTPGGGEHAGTP